MNDVDTGVTYHTAAYTGIYAKHCYGVHSGEWIKPTVQQNIDSAHNKSDQGAATQVYVADLNARPGGKPAKFDGLRLGKQRAIRAKYPNGDPEKSGEWYMMGASQAMGGGEYTQVQKHKQSLHNMLPRDISDRLLCLSSGVGHDRHDLAPAPLLGPPAAGGSRYHWR